MIIPCIDLQEGRAVQLVHGRKRRLAVDDVFGLLDRFREYPLLHVIDLDAAMGKGSNARLVRALCRRAPMRVRVGGGIRTTARAERLLAAGAEKIIVGSAAFRAGRVNRAFLARLAKRVGRRRVIIAVDTDGGQILVRGWQKKLRMRPAEVFPNWPATPPSFSAPMWITKAACEAPASLGSAHCAALRRCPSLPLEEFAATAKSAPLSV